jgi:hypothetical protein
MSSRTPGGKRTPGWIPLGCRGLTMDYCLSRHCAIRPPAGLACAACDSQGYDDDSQ